MKKRIKKLSREVFYIEDFLILKSLENLSEWLKSSLKLFEEDIFFKEKILKIKSNFSVEKNNLIEHCEANRERLILSHNIFFEMK
jgi:hypothetical protein